MICIKKKDEPSWLPVKKEQYGTLTQMWQDTSGKTENHALWAELREKLVDEQHGLCGYCCKKITHKTSHIEHMKCQEFHPQDSLSYENLIASCETKSTCGKHKDNDDTLIVCPTDEDCELQFSFNLYTGEIIGNTEKAENTISVLNLNHYSLKESRYAAFRRALCYPQEIVDAYLATWPQFIDILRFARSRDGKDWDTFRSKRNPDIQ